MSERYPGGLITKTPVTPSGAYETSTASGIWTLEEQAYWRKLNQWPTAGNIQPDPQFNYVSMLLHGDGTNGAQNNTFVDSSTNNFTITRNGNTTQGSFSPYGSNWSNYFDGVGDRLTVANNSAFYLLTNSFTIECWVYLDGAQPPGEAPFLFGNINTASGGGGYLFYLNSDLKPSFYYTTAGTLASGISKVSSTALPLNTWSHFAVSRNGNDWNIFVNGVSNLSTTDTNQVFSSTNAFTISGDYIPNTGVLLKGYISNLRVVNGTAVYTSNFTPPTAPLTAITNTVLLTCQSNRFVDNSTNGFAVTPSGDTSVQRYNPFGTTTAYSTSVIGGSGYFDGTGDYLQAPSGNAAFQFGTGDFTVECWIYQNATNNYPVVLEIDNHSAASGILFFAKNLTGTGEIGAYNGTVGFLGTVSGLALKTWNHIAWVRSSGTFKIYLNGVGNAGLAFTTNLNVSTPVTMGTNQAQTAAYDLSAYVSNLRVVKGTAVYTSNFTPSTAPLTAISGTSLLLSTINGAIFDNAMMNDLETVGNAQISTSVVKYGTGSMYFDSTGDGLIGQNTPNTSLSGNFTIEAWVYQTDAAQNAPMISIGDASTSGGIALYINTSQQLAYAINSASSASGSASINTWHHIAVVRSGSTITTYLNGVAQNIVTYSATFSGVQYFGAIVYSGVTYYGAGYMDDLRITKGYARYTTTFTPPTAAFPNIGPT